MDILAHALWTAGAAVPLRRRFRHPLSIGWAIFWGVFPDVFSFAIPAVVRIWWYLTGTTSSLLPDPHGPQHFQYAWTLYYASHSLVVFGVGFAIAWLLRRRPMTEMLAWGLHILIDIPTHVGFSRSIFFGHCRPMASPDFAGRTTGSWQLITRHYSCCIPC